MVPRLLWAMCVVILASAAPAWAQTDPEFGGRLFIHVEAQSMTAKDSFDAVLGTNMMKGFGAGLDVNEVWKNLFVRFGVSQLKKTGERVFVFEGEVIPLGVPVKVTMTPIEAAAGWRFKPIGSKGIVPYLGAGALFLKHREESPGDGAGDGVNESYKGVLAFAGVEVPVWRSVSAGAEVGWRRAIVKSPGGALAAFGEKDLGGVTFRLMLSFRD